MIITKKRKDIHIKEPASQLELLDSQLCQEKSQMFLQIFRNCLHFQPLQKYDNNPPAADKKEGLREPLLSLHKELLDLFAHPHLAKDHRYLSRFAIRVQQLNHDAALACSHRKTGKVAEQVRHYLNTPLGAPFVIRTSLARAALIFGEQDPQLSDLSEILQEMAKYGPKFNLQLMRIFSLLN